MSDDTIKITGDLKVTGEIKAETTKPEEVPAPADIVQPIIDAVKDAVTPAPEMIPPSDAPIEPGIKGGDQVPS